MRTKELAEEYRRSAALLRGRIGELKEQIAETEDRGERAELISRLLRLADMWRDTRDIADHLEEYYEI